LQPPRDFSQDLEALIAERPKARVLSLRPVIWGSLGSAAVAAAVAVVVFKLTPGFGPTNAVAVGEGSGTKEQRLPGQLQRTTTAVAHEKDSVATPSPQQAARDEHRSLEPKQVLATTAGDVQQVQQPPAEDVTGSHSEQKLPAGKQPAKTDKMPQTTDQTESKSPDAVPQQSGSGRTLSGRTAVAEAYDDDPFAGGAAVVALATSDQTSITEEIGLETDEDGLYAIKM
jgi:hypothetical protein